MFQRGFSLIELLIVAAVISLFFGGLFVTIQNSLKLVTDSRARLSALSVANDTMEYVRSLSYNAVGTVSGLPPGLIPQVSTTTLNGFIFTKRVLIEYVDDPADGIGGADSNAITTDYKRVKVEISWSDRGQDSEIFLVSNVVPRSIETSVDGGTVRVNVFDSTITPLVGAQVRLLNTSGTSTVDVTKSTDATGVVLFGGAPAGAGYQIFVTAPGYSSDQTYFATTSLPNPNKQPIAVVEAGVSTENFFIDRLGGLAMEMYSDRDIQTITNTLASSTNVVTTSNTAFQNGSLLLAGGGVYSASGTAQLTTFAPSTLTKWSSLSVLASTSAQTGYRIRFYSSSTNPVLIPDTDLPGNSSGFTGSNIDLSMISTSIYTELVTIIELTTSSSTVTPAIHSMAVTYVESETPFAGRSVSVTGAKTIGTLLDTSPVYKTVESGITDGDGVLNFFDVEWDTYTITTPGYDISEACYEHPIVVTPGATTTLILITETNSGHSLRVIVKNSSNSLIADATVELERSGTDTKTTSICGQVFFSSLSPFSDYELRVSAPGYSPITIDPLDISGDEVVTVTL